MRHPLTAIMSILKIGTARLLGNRRMEQIGRAELAPTQAGRKAGSTTRPASDRFRVGVGQMTLHEQLAAQVETARQREQPD